eukprot:TRINITY_DN7447_c0_g1_i1.p1 TRINITY_DN7447_c0_g1~~TRINITY_DN7447_c0_g1_i1.p1  ORF type:complete len:254 (-),score=13.99 TRINITY_DN7447_c0_g1_i1:54-815(-)
MEPTPAEYFYMAYSIFYPMLSILFLLTTSLEIMIRKYVYYRLLDHGLIMDWKDRDWKRSYFLPFFGVAIIIFIVAAKGGFEIVSIFILQTALLLIFVKKLYDAEAELITVNKFFQSGYQNNLHILNQHVQFVDEKAIRNDALYILYQFKSQVADINAGKYTVEEMTELWLIDFKRLGRLNYPLPELPTTTSLFGRLEFTFEKNFWGIAIGQKSQSIMVPEVQDDAFFFSPFPNYSVITIVEWFYFDLRILQVY